MVELLTDNAWVTALLALTAIIEATRRWVWPLVKNIVHTIEALPTLIKIAEEFKPNDGKTLRDQVDLINERLNNIEQQLEQVIVER